MPKYLSRLTPLASAAIIAAVCAAPATAAPAKERAVDTRGSDACWPVFMSSGAQFGLGEDGQIYDSESFGRADASYAHDTWDDAGELSFRIADDPEWPKYDFEDYDSDERCTVEDDGREIAYGAEEIDNDLFLARKTFVPTAGAFARTYDTITNRGTTPRTVDLMLEADQYSDADAGIGATSSGDLETTTADSWFTQVDTNGAGGDYDSAHGTFNFQSVSPAQDRADEIFRDYREAALVDRSSRGGVREDRRYVVFRDITVQPGETVAYMNAFGQGATVAETNALAASLGAAPLSLYAGLSVAEQSALRNWTNDADGDGHRTGADNCDTIANADQADLDRDGLGDVCDDDIDGDGLPNAIEAGFGADPRNADSDGDGLPDGADQCPALAGTLNGCPAPQVAVNVAQSTGRALPTGVSLTLSARKERSNASGKKARAAQSGGRTVVRVTGRIGLPNGVPASACRLGRVAVLIKRAERTISTRIVDVRDDCTYRSTVRFKRNLGTKVRAKSYFFGSVGLVGRAAKAKSASVK